MPPTKKDAVHRYFEYEKLTNTTSCLLCQNKLKGRHTTNLKNHLAAKHLNEYQVIVDINQKTVENPKSHSNHTTVAATAETIKKICVRLITVHGRPLAMMEDEAFQEIIHLATDANSDIARLINIKSIKTKINEQAIEIRKKISQEVKNKMISLKLDAATCQERKFIGINIQYIKESKIVIRNLVVQEVYERQTSTFLKKVIEDVLADFIISVEQIYCICTDNGSNMLKMVKLMGGIYISEDLHGENTEENTDEDEFNGEDNVDSEYEENSVFNNIVLEISNFIEINETFKVRGMLCAAHTLQLAVKDAINDEVSTHATISLAKVVVNILRKPNNANSIKKANLRKPVNDCSTRWSSTYNMLVRLLSLKEFCDTISEIYGLVSVTFWEDLKNVVKCLEPANEATIKFQKEQLTIGDFYITWLNCKNKIAAIEHPFPNALLRCMEQREKKLLQNDVVLESLYLDGRLNVILSEEQCQKARLLLTEVYQQINRLKERNISELDDSDHNADLIQTIHSVDEPTPSTSSTDTNLSAVEEILRNSERARGNVAQQRSFDLCFYELSAAPRVDINQNIIVHWHNKAVAYSELADVSMVVLGAPATQVSVERLFSSLKFILHP